MMDSAQKLAMAVASALTVESERDEIETLMKDVYLPQAEAIVHHWRNPFDASAPWEPFLDTYQVRVAVDLFARRGAEGEVSHVENGIDRTWEDEATPYGILRSIARKGKVFSVGGGR